MMPHIPGLGGGVDIYSAAIGDMSPADINFLTNFDGINTMPGSITIAGTGENTIVLPPGVSLPKKKSRPTSSKKTANGDAKARSKRKGTEPTGPGGSGRWTKEEDAKLRSAVAAVGAKNWKRISIEFLDGRRSDVQCLHRWNKVLKPGLVKGPWTADEDEIIRGCIQEGITKWSEIAAKVPGRIGKQCRERWFNHLDPGIKKSEWSDEEDQILISAQAEMGNKWCEIAKMLPGRSENAVKNRWNSATRRKQQFGGGDGDSSAPKPRKKSQASSASKENFSSSNRRKNTSLDESITPTAPIRAQLDGGLGDSTSPSWGSLLPGDMASMGMGMGMPGMLGVGSNFASLGGLMAAGLGGMSIGSSLDADDAAAMAAVTSIGDACPLPMPTHIKMEDSDSHAMPPPPPAPAPSGDGTMAMGGSGTSGNGKDSSKSRLHEQILANLFKTQDGKEDAAVSDPFRPKSQQQSIKPAVSADFAAQEAERMQLFSGVSFSAKEKQQLENNLQVQGVEDDGNATEDEGSEAAGAIGTMTTAAELEEVTQFDLDGMFDLLPQSGKGGGRGGGRGRASKSQGRGAGAPPPVTFVVKSAQGEQNSAVETLKASLDDLDITIPGTPPVAVGDQMFQCAPLTA